jgi:Tol biopolymer transport system component
MESLKRIESDDPTANPGMPRGRASAALCCAVAMALLIQVGTAIAAPAGSTFLVSRPDGTGTLSAVTDNTSMGPVAISAEGRYIAFISGADGYAPGANPDVFNVFVRDTVSNTTTLVSRSDGVNGAGANAGPHLTESESLGIAVAPGSQVPDAPHDRPHVLVAFPSFATNLVDHTEHAIPSTGGLQQIWLRDVTAGTTYLVSRAGGSTGKPGNGDSSEPVIAAAPTGALVAFTSRASNFTGLLPQPGLREVFMRDVTFGNTAEVSCPSHTCGSGPPQGESYEPSIQYGEPLRQVCDGPCAMVAFTTADPTIAPQASPLDTQVEMATSFDTPEAPGFTGFGDYHEESALGPFPPEPGNDSSFAPQVLSDGSGVAFLSGATNFHPAIQAPDGGVEGYFHFRGNEAFDLVTVYNDGSHVFLPDAPVSDFSVKRLSPTDGLHLLSVFGSKALNLGAPQQSGVSEHIYRDLSPKLTLPPGLLDRAAGAGGALGNANSWDPVMSADGSTLAFVSNATNLGAGGSSEFTRVYARRIAPNAPDSESLQLVSRPSGGGAFSSPGSIDASLKSRATSADGRFVAFESGADNLSSADDNSKENVYVRDTVNGTTTLVSRATGAGGAGANANARLCGISEDGKRVAFVSSAGNLNTFGEATLYAYVRDLGAQTTTLVSRTNGPTGTPGNTTLEGCSISGDGDRVAFVSGPPLDPQAGNGVPGHLYVRDLSEQTTIFVDRDNGAKGTPAEKEALESSLNRDGTRVAWVTEASLGGAGAGTLARFRLYVRDLKANTTVLASRADGASGGEANGESRAPALDAAGNAVAFESTATNVGGFGGRAILVRRLNNGRTELVSRATGSNGEAADRNSFAPSIDAAGDRVAFVSGADNLIAPQPGGTQAYVRDLTARTTELVSRVNGVGGAPARPAFPGQVSLSASGDCVAFSGTGSNFTDALSGSDFPQVRERVLRGNCGPGTDFAAAIAEPPAEEPAPAVLSRMRMQPARFFVGAGGGTEIAFVLSEASPITVSFRRVLGAGSARRNLRKAGSLVVHGRAGRNSIHFSGRVRGRALVPGHYRWKAAAPSGPVVSGGFVVMSRQ